MNLIFLIIVLTTLLGQSAQTDFQSNQLTLFPESVEFPVIEEPKKKILSRRRKRRRKSQFSKRNKMEEKVMNLTVEAKVLFQCTNSYSLDCEYVPAAGDFPYRCRYAKEENDV